MDILLIVFLAAVITYGLFYISQFRNVIFRGYAPVLATDRETIKAIIGQAGISDGAVVYELGCGRARFLRLAERSCPGALYIGIENLWSVQVFTSLWLKSIGSNIKIVNADIFDVNLADADLVYCYLNDTTMGKLHDKFRNECRPGTRIISRRFSIPHMDPDRVAVMRGKKIYFYTV